MEMNSASPERMNAELLRQQEAFPREMWSCKSDSAETANQIDRHHGRLIISGQSSRYNGHRFRPDYSNTKRREGY
jgi:hypothetical protein